MKTKIFFISLIMGLCTGQRVVPQSESGLSIRYEEALTEITIEGERLTYYSKGPMPGAGNLAGPEEYVGSFQEKDLSQGEIEKLKQWIDEYGVCDLVNPDSQGDPESYEAAFFHRLKVQCEDDTCNLEWTDASSWNQSDEKQKVDQAVAELKNISREFLE